MTNTRVMICLPPDTSWILVAFDLNNRNKIDVRHSTRDLRDRKIGRRICGVSGICPILNEVLQHDLEIPNNANRKSPDTPLSYPFLWDSPQHDKVQWNGSAPNRVL